MVRAGARCHVCACVCVCACVLGVHNSPTCASLRAAHARMCAAPNVHAQHMLKHGIFERAARMEPAMNRGMKMLQDKHPCVKQTRYLGLFGAFDIQVAAAPRPRCRSRCESCVCMCVCVG
jgi:adenosylmethionine-8-amino-7-oxononanoate aminotransferase